MSRILAAAAIITLLAGGGALASWRLGVWDSADVRSAGERLGERIASLSGRDDQLDPEQATNACEALAARADQIAAGGPSAAVLLRQLGNEAAGIREGAAGLVDLARGGRNRIPGGGFRGAYDDGTAGQARHFAGIAVAASYGGGRATRLISIHARRDGRRSADGRLTERGIEFARKLLTGRIEVDRAGEWILTRLCAPG